MRGILYGHLELGMTKSLAIQSANKLAAELYKPIMDKIDPYHLHESLRNAELSIRYGSSLLQDGMVKDRKNAIDISRYLTNNYTSHDYAIMEMEAKELGLNVDNIANFDDNTFVQAQYNNTSPNNITFVGQKNKKGVKTNA